MCHIVFKLQLNQVSQLRCQGRQTYSSVQYEQLSVFGGIPGDDRKSQTCIEWEAAGSAGCVRLSHPSASAHTPLSCTTPYKETPGSALSPSQCCVRTHTNTDTYTVHTCSSCIYTFSSKSQCICKIHTLIQQDTTC